MEPQPLLIYTPRYIQFDYGRGHPLRLYRLKLAYELMKDLNLLSPPVKVEEPQEAPQDILLTFHKPDYLKALEKADQGYPLQGDYGLGTKDNPVFPGVYSFSKLVVGGTWRGSYRALEGRRVFHMGGGMHHAQPGEAEGFCYLNDIVISLSELEKKGLKVLYLDIDAHHCNAVQEAFYHSPQILIVSFHQYDGEIYPGTGALEEMGEGEGKGYNLNLPLDRYTEDETLWWAYQELIPPLLEAFQPDILFTQLGVDGHKDDPLTSLLLTTGFYERFAQDLASRWHGPWIAVGGGGYDLVNVARIWAIIWAYMAGRKIPDQLPESFLRVAIMEGYDGPFIQDLPGWTGIPGHVPPETRKRIKFLANNCPLLK